MAKDVVHKSEFPDTPKCFRIDNRILIGKRCSYKCNTSESHIYPIPTGSSENFLFTEKKIFGICYFAVIKKLFRVNPSIK